MVAFAPGLSTSLQRAVGIHAETKIAQGQVKSDSSETNAALIPMSDEQIKLAQINQIIVGPAKITRRAIVPGTIVPHADHIVHVAVKLSGTVAELRKHRRRGRQG
jgi:membrane fusion protein, heavy metal efflux system